VRVVTVKLHSAGMSSRDGPPFASTKSKNGASCSRIVSSFDALAARAAAVSPGTRSCDRAYRAAR